MFSITVKRTKENIQVLAKFAIEFEEFTFKYIIEKDYINVTASSQLLINSMDLILEK